MDSVVGIRGPCFWLGYSAVKMIDAPRDLGMQCGFIMYLDPNKPNFTKHFTLINSFYPLLNAIILVSNSRS